MQFANDAASGLGCMIHKAEKWSEEDEKKLFY